MKKILLFLLVLSFKLTLINAQAWINYLPDSLKDIDNQNFYTIQKAFYEYLEDLNDQKVKKSGFIESAS